MTSLASHPIAHLRQRHLASHHLSSFDQQLPQLQGPHAQPQTQYPADVAEAFDWVKLDQAGPRHLHAIAKTDSNGRSSNFLVGGEFCNSFSYLAGKPTLCCCNSCKILGMCHVSTAFREVYKDGLFGDLEVVVASCRPERIEVW